MKTNCLNHAFDRWTERGGFALLFRVSAHWDFLHVMHIDASGVLTSYAPEQDLSHPIHALLGFDGSVFNEDLVPATPVKPWVVVVGCIVLALHAIKWWVCRPWRKK